MDQSEREYEPAGILKRPDQTGRVKNLSQELRGYAFDNGNKRTVIISPEKAIEIADHIERQDKVIEAVRELLPTIRQYPAATKRNRVEAWKRISEAYHPTATALTEHDKAEGGTPE